MTLGEFLKELKGRGGNVFGVRVFLEDDDFFSRGAYVRAVNTSAFYVRSPAYSSATRIDFLSFNGSREVVAVLSEKTVRGLSTVLLLGEPLWQA